MNHHNGLDELLRVFSDPIIVWPGSDGAFSASVREAITVARMARAAQGLKDLAVLELATLPEAMVYLSTVSLSFPLSSEWTRVYMYCFTQVMGARTPVDCRAEDLTTYEQSQFLKPLLGWIRRKQDQRWKVRRREESAAREPAQTPHVEQLAFTFK